MTLSGGRAIRFRPETQSCPQTLGRQRRRVGEGWYHPDYPKYSVDSVSKPYFDGNADLQRVRVLVLGPDSKLNTAPLEDMVADRLGQYAASTNDPHPLVQAKLLFALGDGSTSLIFESLWRKKVAI